jgi:hypothetical protein
MHDYLAEATPKTILRTMGVKGLTLFHLKSHLQVIHNTFACLAKFEIQLFKFDLPRPEI